jgi:replicative DNA helicase
MAEKNTSKLTPFEKQQAEAAKQILEYKLGAEASIVSMIYKNPDLLRETNLQLNDIHNNCWRVYFEIARDLIVNEKKVTLSEVDIGLYLEKHPKLADKYYNEYCGYQTIENAGFYIKEENFESYVRDLRKWNVVARLVKHGFPCDKARLSEICDMSAEELYDEYTVYLNDIFANIDNNIKSYNGFDGMKTLIDELDAGKNVGIPFANCDILNRETGGMLGGNIIGFGASSGVGKSTLSINYVFPSMIKHDLKALFIINEEDEQKFRKEALVWYCSNILKHPIPKRVLRDGNFDKETKEVLYKAAEWFESQKEKRHITIIPLEQYTARTVIKLIKKYTKMGCDVIVLDTLKESFDSRDKESWKSLMTDCVDFYDCIKHTNTCMIITYQLVKNKSKYLTNADIGISKGILDIFSLNIFFRRPLQTEYEGGKDELYCYNPIKNSSSRTEFHLKKDRHYMIGFISKNRFGMSDIQIVSEADFSINQYKDLGYCTVVQDF